MAQQHVSKAACSCAGNEIAWHIEQQRRLLQMGWVKMSRLWSKFNISHADVLHPEGEKLSKQLPKTHEMESSNRKSPPSVGRSPPITSFAGSNGLLFETLRVSELILRAL